MDLSFDTTLPPGSNSSLPRVLGITGGIGAGKSYIAGALAPFMPVFDCDRSAKTIYSSPNKAYTDALKALLGPDIYQDGAPQFKLIAQRLFSQPELLRRAEALIHPYVREEFARWRSQFATTPQPAPAPAEGNSSSAPEDALRVLGHQSAVMPPGWVGLESAILIEKGFDALCHAVLYIDAPRDLRLQRVEARDGAPRRAILRRMNAQHSLVTTYSARPLLVFSNDKPGLSPSFFPLLRSFLESVPL